MAKTTPSKKEEVKDGDFTAKKIGANLIVSVVGTTEKFTRKVTAEEGEKIMRKMALYNKKPTESGKKALIKLLTPELTKKKEDKEKVAVKTKAIKKQIKKITKREAKKEAVAVEGRKDLMTELTELLTTDETAVGRLQALLNKFKKVEEAVPTATAAPTRRYRDEH
jgi:transcriptional regulator NrdR family protein